MSEILLCKNNIDNILNVKNHKSFITLQVLGKITTLRK